MGMSEKAFYRLVTSLPGVTEAPHFNRKAFRANERIFSTMVPDGDEVMVKVEPYEKIEALLDSFPDTFITYGGFTTKMGSLGVRLSKVEPGLLEDLLREAHAVQMSKAKGRAAPKKIASKRAASAKKTASKKTTAKPTKKKKARAKK